jgi:hypothetical protein
MHVPGVQSQKIPIVAVFDEDVFTVVASIVDMVDPAVFERYWIGHR